MTEARSTPGARRRPHQHAARAAARADAADRAAGRRANRLQLAAERARQNAAWHAERAGRQPRSWPNWTAARPSCRTSIAGADRPSWLQAAGGSRGSRAARAGRSSTPTTWWPTLARLRAEAEVSAAQRQSYQHRVAELQPGARAAHGRICRTKEQRIAALSQPAGRGATGDRPSTGSRPSKLAAEIASLSRADRPGRSPPGADRAGAARRRAQERALREQLRQAQMRQSQAELALQRAQDEPDPPARRDRERAGPGRARGRRGLADSQPPLPLNGMVTQLPAVASCRRGWSATCTTCEPRSAAWARSTWMR